MLEPAGDRNQLVRPATQFVADTVDQEIDVAIAAVDFGARASSTVNIGTRSENSPSSTSDGNSAWPRLEFCPQKAMPQLPSPPVSISGPLVMPPSCKLPGSASGASAAKLNPGVS
jgi:hypothetical protein